MLLFFLSSFMPAMIAPVICCSITIFLLLYIRILFCLQSRFVLPKTAVTGMTARRAGVVALPPQSETMRTGIHSSLYPARLQTASRTPPKPAGRLKKRKPGVSAAETGTPGKFILQEISRPDRGHPAGPAAWCGTCWQVLRWCSWLSAGR